MKDIPYTFGVGNLMYLQVCIHTDSAYAVKVLEKFQSNPRMIHLKVATKVTRYLQRIKDPMLTFQGVMISVLLDIQILILLDVHLA